MRTGFRGWHILQEGISCRRAYFAGGHALQEDMCEKGLLSLLVCSTFVVDVSGGHFLFLNVVSVLFWLKCYVNVIGALPLSHSGASLIAW